MRHICELILGLYKWTAIFLCVFILVIEWNNNLNFLDKNSHIIPNQIRLEIGEDGNK